MLKSNLSKSLYILGALIIVMAMSLLFPLIWHRYQWQGIFIFGLLSFAILIGLGSFLFFYKKITTAGGLLLSAATSTIPLWIFGLEGLLNTWTTLSLVANRLLMAVSTLIISVLIWIVSRYHLLVVPIIISLWFTIIQSIVLFIEPHLNWFQKRWIMLAYSVGLILCSIILEKLKKPGYAFWFYLLGAVGFWLNLTFLLDKMPWQRLIYLFVNIALLVLAATTKRLLLLLISIIGIVIYLTNLINYFTNNRILLVASLSAVGVIILFSGVLLKNKLTRYKI